MHSTDELHHATGDTLLLISPAIHMALGPERRAPTAAEAIAVFESGLFPAYMGFGNVPVNVTDQVLQFLRSLTEQTYELATFFGLERSQIPAILPSSKESASSTGPGAGGTGSGQYISSLGKPGQERLTSERSICACSYAHFLSSG
jgi:hypothetical protein